MSEISLQENKPEYERNDARLTTGMVGIKSRLGISLKIWWNLKVIFYDPKMGYSGINDLVTKGDLYKSEEENFSAHREFANYISL